MSRHLSSHHVFVSVCVVQTTLSHVPMARSSNDGYTLTSPGTPLAGHDSMGASNSRSRGMRWCASRVTGGKRISITSLSPSSSTWAWMHTVHSSAPSHVCLMMLKSGETCLQSLTHARFLAFFSPFFKRNRKNRWTMTPTHTHNNSSSNDDASTAQVFYKGVQSCEADTERSFRDVRCCALVSCMRTKKSDADKRLSSSPTPCSLHLSPVAAGVVQDDCAAQAVAVQRTASASGGCVAQAQAVLLGASSAYTTALRAVRHCWQQPR